MRIGIIVFSYTGNTLSVAKLIKKRIGNNCELEEIKIENDYKSGNHKIILSPKLNKYDVIILGSPVNAFSLSPVMVDYLKEISDLKNKKVCTFVTQFFPFPWLGGTRALKMFKEAIILKNGQVIYGGVINWSNKKRDELTESLITDIEKIIKGDSNDN